MWSLTAELFSNASGYPRVKRIGKQLLHHLRQAAETRTDIIPSPLLNTTADDD